MERNFERNFVKKMDFFSQNDSLENSLICPKNKSASHCPTELFPIYPINHWTIRRRDNHTVVPSSHRIILKIVRFLPSYAGHVGATRWDVISIYLGLCTVEAAYSVYVDMWTSCSTLYSLDCQRWTDNYNSKLLHNYEYGIIFNNFLQN